MRILYISNGQSPDYLCDMVFHGLRCELGPEIVDLERVWYMYADEFGPGRHDQSKLYGRGFTVFGLLWAGLVVVPGLVLLLLPMGVAGAAQLVVAADRPAEPAPRRRRRELPEVLPARDEDEEVPSVLPADGDEAG